jgi:hypothetical protein
MEDAVTEPVALTLPPLQGLSAGFEFPIPTLPLPIPPGSAGDGCWAKATPLHRIQTKVRRTHGRLYFAPHGYYLDTAKKRAQIEHCD